MPTIRIHSHSFILSDPYSSGLREVGPKELAALDRLRAENIRNNAAKKMDKREWPLPADALQKFSQEIALMDEEYEFPAQQNNGVRTRSGAFDRLVKKIAEEEAWQELQQEGKLQPQEQELEARAKELESATQVQQEARRRLEVQSQIALQALEEILG